MSNHAANRFERPLLERYRPNRSAGTFYRAAVDDPDALGGVALDSVESAVTAAVRMGYKVASAQVDRTARLARRLRDAGDQAAGVRRDKGESSEKTALDATEQLIFKAMMAGLSWLEGVAAEEGNPLKRAASAQFRLLGSMLGLLPSDQLAAGARRRPDERPLRDDELERVSPRGSRGQGRRLPQVRHARGRGKAQTPRVVRIHDWDLAAEAVGNYLVTFYRDGPGGGTITGELSVSRTGTSTLTVKTTGKSVAGHYKAAICDENGLQLGRLEIVL